MNDQALIQDSLERVWPGDLSRQEITVVQPALFDDDGMYVQLLEDEVQFPGGRRDRLVRVTRSPRAPDGVVIAPIDDEDRVILVRQFRHAPRLWLWEVPRGATEEGKTPLEALKAELLEEIGCEPVEEPLALGRLVPDSGTLHEMPYLFAVRVRPHARGNTGPEANEVITEQRAVAYDDLWQLCESGALNDSCTLAMVLRLRPYFEDGVFKPRRADKNG